MQEDRQSGLTPTEIIHRSDPESVVQHGVEAADVAAQASNVGSPFNPVESSVLAHLHAVGGRREMAGCGRDASSVPGQVNGGGADNVHVRLLNVHPGWYCGQTVHGIQSTHGRSQADRGYTMDSQHASWVVLRTDSTQDTVNTWMFTSRQRLHN